MNQPTCGQSAQSEVQGQLDELANLIDTTTSLAGELNNRLAIVSSPEYDKKESDAKPQDMPVSTMGQYLYQQAGNMRDLAERLRDTIARLRI